jgi:hypothetical protein
MASSNKVENKVARMPDSIATPEEMVAAGNKHIPSITGNKAVTQGQAPEVEAAAKLWSDEQQNLVAANQKVIDADAAAAKARTERATIQRRWKGRAHGCINAIDVFADGSEQVIKEFLLEPAERHAAPLETVPQGLHGVQVKTSGIATGTWKTHPGNNGYMVQCAQNPADPATYSAPAFVTKGRFQLMGQTPGTTVHLRVAACDSRLPGGMTPYTAWVALIASL